MDENTTPVEIVDWAIGKGVGFDEYLKRIVAEKNVGEIMEAFKEIIQYGEMRHYW